MTSTDVATDSEGAKAIVRCHFLVMKLNMKGGEGGPFNTKIDLTIFGGK